MYSYRVRAVIQLLSLSLDSCDKEVWEPWLVSANNALSFCTIQNARLWLLGRIRVRIPTATNITLTAAPSPARGCMYKCVYKYKYKYVCTIIFSSSGLVSWCLL